VVRAHSMLQTYFPPTTQIAVNTFFFFFL